MIYHKDWLIRQIEQMVDALTHLIAGIPSAATWTQSFELEQREQIEKMLRAGEICRAEDWLYENMNPEELGWFPLALEFYQKLNAMTDADLKSRNFTREEIGEGLQYLSQLYGLPLL